MGENNQELLEKVLLALTSKILEIQIPHLICSK